MMKTKTITNAHRFLGVAAVLLLITAALFVGAAAANGGSSSTIVVDNAKDLATNISLLDTQSPVKIRITGSGFEIKEAELKKIVTSVGTAALRPDFTGNKMLDVTIDESVTLTVIPDSTNNAQKVTLAGSCTITVSRTGSASDNVAEIVVKGGKITAYHSSTEFVSVDDIESITAQLETISEEINGFKKSTYFISADSERCKITIQKGETDLTYQVRSANLDKEQIKFNAKSNPYLIQASTIDDKPLNGIIILDDGTEIKFRSAEGDIYASYNQKPVVTGNITSACVYETNSNGEYVVNIELTKVKGAYGSETKLSGTVTLMDNLKLTRQIPVLSFMEGTLNLNGFEVDNVNYALLTSGSSTGKVTLTGIGTFKREVSDYERFKIDSNFMWVPDEHTALTVNSTKPGDFQKIKSLTVLGAPATLGSTTKSISPTISVSGGYWTIGEIIAAFELTPTNDGDKDKSATVLITLAPGYTATDLRVFHLRSSGWEVYELEGTEEFRFFTRGMSPFFVAKATYTQTHSGGGGGGGGGSSVIPTYTPGVTPTPTPTQPWTPIDPSQTGVQPSQSPKSPMPVFGILAGLGAAALAGVVLRRK